MTLLASVMLLASACTGKQASEKTASGLEPANFRTEVDGKQTDLFVLENKNGMEVCITNFGGRIVSVMVPDKDGVMRDVCRHPGGTSGRPIKKMPYHRSHQRNHLSKVCRTQ